MRDNGQVSVFLCVILTSMLLLGLTVVEMTRVSMGRAKAAEAAAGAAAEVKAAYHRELFEEYHLLAVDREFGGQGEGKMEQMAQDYLEYTLENGQEDEMKVEQSALADCRGLLDNDCENMKDQITEYMKLYAQKDGLTKLKDLITGEKKAGEDSVKAVEAGRGEQSDGSDSWTGTDPRKTLKKTTAGGIMGLVVPDGEVPSRDVFTTPELPSHGKTGSDAEWEDIEFDDIDEFENRLKPDSDDIVSRLSDNFYGIYYALENFDMYTDGHRNRPVKCEAEYIICGKDNDYANLKDVVNRLILHRLPVNFAYLMKDKKRQAAVAPIAAVLALIPGVTYHASKYLLLGCWAYAETLVDIKVLLAGKSVQFFKTNETWHTDIADLGRLTDMDAVDYDGVDSIDYKGYLALLLAENTGDMYYRMADLIQINLSQKDESFEMVNMIYRFSLDVEVVQEKKFASFVESGSGVKIEDGWYRHGFRVSAGY